MIYKPGMSPPSFESTSLRPEAELLEQGGMALGIDLVGHFLLSLFDPVGLALLAEQVQELVLGDLQLFLSKVDRVGAMCGGLRRKAVTAPNAP